VTIPVNLKGDTTSPKRSIWPLLNVMQRSTMATLADWDRVDRTISKCRQLLADAVVEDDFQTIGLRCREALISLAQVVWDETRHPTLDGIAPSETDAKRRLEAYIAAELASSANEEARKHSRSALAFALALQHKRTAVYRDAALCLEGTVAVVNLVAIIQGHRSPSQPRSDLGTAVAWTAERVKTPAPQLMNQEKVFSAEVIEEIAPIPADLAALADEVVAERLSRIFAGGCLPTVLTRGPKLIIHIVPMFALKKGASIDHQAMQNSRSRFKPPQYESFDERTNIEGWHLWQPPESVPLLPNPVSSWCSMVTNEGITEIIMTLETADVGGVSFTLGYPLEADIVETLDQVADGYAMLRIRGLSCPRSRRAKSRARFCR
jgi:hypothetical protein